MHVDDAPAQTAQTQLYRQRRECHARSVQLGEVSRLAPLPFGSLTDRTLHLCIDMQNLFASETPWHTPWMERAVPVVVRIVELCPSRTVFTRFIPPHRPDQMPGCWALLRTLGRVFGS
jgi:hypothetical protein